MFTLDPLQAIISGSDRLLEINSRSITGVNARKSEPDQDRIRRSWSPLRGRSDPEQRFKNRSENARRIMVTRDQWRTACSVRWVREVRWAREFRAILIIILQLLCTYVGYLSCWVHLLMLVGCSVVLIFMSDSDMQCIIRPIISECLHATRL